MKSAIIWILLGTMAFFLNFQPAHADMCPLAKEMAVKSLKAFDKDPKKGLSGLIQARKLCPGDREIAYNLGLAYYRYKRPDMAYKTWKKMVEKETRDLKLFTNLAWLALELGKGDEAASWAEKADRVSPGDPNVAALTMEVMFSRGKYAEALAYAQKNRSHLPADTVKKATEYATEAQWNTFRKGRKEQAAQEMLKLSQRYPGDRSLAEAKDKMVAALLNNNADIPLPKPLPDQRAGGDGWQASESEVLPLRSAKSTVKPRSDAYALIVGIRKYQNLNGPGFADQDARQVQRLLTKMGGFRNDPAHIRLRLNSDATIGTLYGDLKWLGRKARLNPNAKVFFYFSGHGSPVLGSDKTTIKDGLLVPYEATLDNLDDRTAISLAYLKNELGRLSNKEVVCLIDACFSGSGKSVSGMKLIKPRVNKKLLTSNKLFISAAAADRPAEEYAPGQQGAFTYFFLKALMGEGDENENGWVDTLEAYQYACDKLEALGLEQNPQMSVRTAIPISRVK